MKPQGYKELLTWKQSGDIYIKAKGFTAKYLDRIKDSRLIGHINDSARSVQRNIEEGYMRTTTKEYISFLGFSHGSLEELKRDFEELKREYLEGIRRGDKGVIGVIDGLLDLIYGEDCMLGRQIKSLDKKMADEKTLPRNRMIMGAHKRRGEEERKFWRIVEKDYGLTRCADGKFVKLDKGSDKGR